MQYIDIIHMGLCLEVVLIYVLQVVENQIIIIIALKAFITLEIIIFLGIMDKLTFKFQIMKFIK